MCRVCARLRLPCEYGLRLRCGQEAVGPDGSKQLQVCEIDPVPGVRKPKPIHFVHFIIHDFGSGFGSPPESLDLEDEWSSSSLPCSVIHHDWESLAVKPFFWIFVPGG